MPKRGIGDRAESVVAAEADRDQISFATALRRAAAGTVHGLATRSQRNIADFVEMLDALAEWMHYPMYRAAYGHQPWVREAVTNPLVAPYGAHRTADGSVIFGLQNDREWVVFAREVLRRPEVARDLEGPRDAEAAAEDAP